MSYLTPLLKKMVALFIGLIEPSADNKVLCETLLHGLQDISAQYPQNLQVVVKGN
jgi:uncharacterized protein